MKDILQEGKVYRVNYHIGQFTGETYGTFAGISGCWAKFLPTKDSPSYDGFAATWVRVENIVAIMEAGCGTDESKP
jgi:hypothetical protein